ncbi:MAG: poly-beta-1,6-N-acetyl-D-glucosamine N-deacetylase PgaB [Candidatus Omnitrophica bacterium]|nr:poly-beta-1,6-N-acetyl-D-glucosamine N-deacetylase PgaB [Candidatus Omnitrophota bacterium]
MMKTNNKILLFILSIAFFSFASVPLLAANEGTIVLSYHDVPKEVNLDDFGADQQSFVNTIEYFKMHGYTFISLDELVKSKKGGIVLPEKTILLTFDDAYESFYEFAYPLLAEYKIPCTLAVVSSWIEGGDTEYVKHSLMSWEQIREAANSPYVEVISHSHNLHRGVIYNPQGNSAPAAVSRQYDTDTQTYEDEAAYVKRIYDDLKTSKEMLEEKTGKMVRAIAWPYGLYNEITIEQAAKLGLEVQFTLNDKIVAPNRFGQISRFLIHKNPTVLDLLKDLKLVPNGYSQERIVQADLDMIYDPDPDQTERNLSAFLDRVKDMRVTSVYLQAFCDIEGTGNIREVYFPNRVLPVKQDLFSRVAHQLKSRANVNVYAWMPMLSIELPEDAARDGLYVREFNEGESKVSTSWYKRLSPFSPATEEILTKLYEDLAVHANMDGIVFLDDGYLNEEEDFHPDAVAEYEIVVGDEKLAAPLGASISERKAWTESKTKKLNELSEHLLKAVARYRPEIKSARTLYAPVVLDDSTMERFSQSYEESLALYDYVVIMAYPYLEEVKAPKKWLAKLVAVAKTQPEGIEKTVFKIQTFDWKKKGWIDSKILDQWLRTLVSAGARHLAYYPDDYVLDYPEKGIIRAMMSVEDFPSERDWK